MAVGDMDDCPHHHKQKVVLFCQTCDELICTKCISRSPTSSARHQDHVYLDLMDAYDMQKEDMVKVRAHLKDSVEMKRQQRQETLTRIQKLKFALLRKKGFVSKECRSLQSLIRTEEQHFNKRLKNVIGTALECEERAHTELDFDTVSREGLLGTIDSISKISPFRCTHYLKNITRVKKEVLAALQRDTENTVLGSGNLWSAQISRLRDVTLHVHGEKVALRRSFRFPTEAPSTPRVLISWCVVGSDCANLVWKYRRQEKVDRFKVTFTPLHPQRTRHLRRQRIVLVRPVVAKRNHVVLRDLEENCEYVVRVSAVNSVAESVPACVHVFTHAPPEMLRQGRVWSEAIGLGVRPPGLNHVVRWALWLTASCVVIFALLWIAFATFEREFCGVLRDNPRSKTPTQHFEDMCPMPDQMRITMETAAEEKEESQASSWLDWFNR